LSASSACFGWLAAAAFAGIFIAAALGRLVRGRPPELPADAARPAAWVAGAILLCFVVLGCALVPLMLRLFVSMQASIGNADLWLVRLLREHERGVTLTMWTMFALGTLIALPVMARDMLGLDLFGALSGPGKSQGTLVLDVGMPLAEVRQRSTLKLVDESRGGLTPEGRVIARGIFDLQIADSALSFPLCRYYWIHTDGSDASRVQDVNVGISPRTLTRAALLEAHRQVQERLRQDGWQEGAIPHRTPEEQRLHGGAASTGQGFYWARGGTLLQLSARRMDEERRGEDPGTAGQWIQVLELRARGGSSDARVEFG
jgi:hypothetical protein